MKVTLRKKSISKGRLSLYLDYYPPLVDPETKRSTRREFLSLYLYEKPSSPLEREHNKETKLLAEGVRAKRQLDVQRSHYDFVFRKSKSVDFLEFFKELTRKKWSSDGNHGNWLSAYNHLKLFTNDSLQTSEIDEQFCEAFKKYLQNASRIKSKTRKLSINSQAAYFSRFSLAIEEAFKKGLFDENPMKRISPIKQKETSREFLTFEELQALANTDCEIPELKKAALFSALTGLRWSDLINLTWGEIQYSKMNGYFVRFIHSKTDRPQTLNVSDQAVELLGERQEPNDKIFSGLRYSAWTNLKLSQWIMAAGISKKITFHCFRHTFATLQLSFGTDIYTVSKLLNHKSLSTTQIYTRVIDEKKREAANIIPRLKS